MLPRKALGNTGLSCSRLGLGTVKFGRNQGVKYPTRFDLPSDQELRNLLTLAKDVGVNVLDTAPAYGISEERLGPLLKGQREDWVLSSKAGEEFQNGASSFNFSPKHIRHSVERSLRRLKTDYLDVLMLHSNGDDLSILDDQELLQTLDALKREGKIRVSGFSGKTCEGGLLALQHLDMAMITYNFNEVDEKPVIQYAAQHKRGIYIKKALSSGHAAHQAGEDAVLNSFRFALETPGVTSVIVGTINPHHLQSNVKKMLEALKLPAD